MKRKYTSLLNAKYLINPDLKHDTQFRHITSRKYNLIPPNAWFRGKVRLRSQKLPLIPKGRHHQTCSSLTPHLIPMRVAKLIFFSFLFSFLPLASWSLIRKKKMRETEVRMYTEIQRDNTLHRAFSGTDELSSVSAGAQGLGR